MNLTINDKTIPTQTVRTNVNDMTKLDDLIEQAEKKNTRFLVSRPGKLSVVMMSFEDYLRNILPTHPVLEEIWAQSAVAGGNELTDEEIYKMIDEAQEEK